MGCSSSLVHSSVARAPSRHRSVGKSPDVSKVHNCSNANLEIAERDSLEQSRRSRGISAEDSSCDASSFLSSRGRDSEGSYSLTMSLANEIRQTLQERRPPTLADRRRQAACKTPRTRQRSSEGAIREMLIRRIESAHMEAAFGVAPPSWIYKANLDELRGHLESITSQGRCCVGAPRGLARRDHGLIKRCEARAAR